MIKELQNQRWLPARKAPQTKYVVNVSSINDMI